MTYKTLDLQQGSKSWLDYRASRIGASDVSAILGIGHDTPYKKWLEKFGFGEKKTSPAMQHGIDHEPIAREAFIKETGILVTPRVIESTIHKFMLASLDGLDFDEKCAVEIKCPYHRENHDIALDGMVPEIYYPQLQHQMFILQIPMMYYFSWFEDSTKIIEVPYDNAYVINMIEKEKEFYECMQSLSPPTLSARDYATCTDPEALNKANMLIELKQKMKEMERQEEELKTDLIQYASQSNMKIGDLSVSKVIKKGAIDYKGIPLLKEVDLETHRKPSTTYWRVA